MRYNQKAFCDFLINPAVLPMTDIYKFLENNGIHYQRFDHPAVYTVEEAERLCPKMPGASIKNLFLRDKNGKRHFLAVVGWKKSVDLKKLNELLGVSGLSFASPERLQKYLGVEPGSVTLLGLIKDQNHEVEVVIDKQLWGQALQCHPLVNTATLVMPADGIERFLKKTGHVYQTIEIPERK